MLLIGSLTHATLEPYVLHPCPQSSGQCSCSQHYPDPFIRCIARIRRFAAAIDIRLHSPPHFSRPQESRCTHSHPAVDAPPLSKSIGPHWRPMAAPFGNQSAREALPMERVSRFSIFSLSLRCISQLPYGFSGCLRCPPPRPVPRRSPWMAQSP